MHSMTLHIGSALLCAALSLAAPASAQSSYVNWESPHVHPLDMTPDGSRVLAVNTADNRLEVFSVGGGGLTHIGSVPVGLDPVSVRARTNGEAWVVNHVSDSVSIVDLDAMNVIETILTGDEPADVIFAGAPQRAFVSVSQLNQVKVYDPASPASSPIVLTVQGEDPRGLATDGVNVYVAIFESGNGTTIIDESAVSNAALNPYAGDPNPPPNDGAAFDPPINGALPPAPNVSLILQKDAFGNWIDDNGGDWSSAVTWDLHGHDLAVIGANSLAVSYVEGLLNANMTLAVDPSGDVLVVGTEALNHIRFEPNVRGVFVRVTGALVSPGSSVPFLLADLNPHLDYTTATVPQATRDLSIGDPRGIAFNASGSRVFITGMGSNNLVVTDSTLGRVSQADVGEGPTGVLADNLNDVVYVLNKFEGTISVVSQTTLAESQRLGFHDPTPAVIKDGRPHLYDTHATSGLGHLSCASCHIDGRMDQVAWDLGDPSGAVKPFNAVCNFGLFDLCEDWHPMKGPMATQTLVGIINPPPNPMHWRADREDLAAFNGAFESLLGDDEQLTVGQMQQFEDFVATLTPPPNPNRNISNSLKTLVVTSTGTGNAVVGSSLFNTANLDAVECVTCHTLPTGTNGQLTSANLIQESQSMKIPQLRNMHEKTGFSQSSSVNNRGFGYIHDGSVDSLFSFLQFSGFNFAAGATGNQQRRDVTAFLLSFATDTHAGVGQQVTLSGDAGDDLVRRGELVTIANLGQVGLVVKGVYNGETRGFMYTGGNQFQSDRAAEGVTLAALDAAVGAGLELTFTLVPLVSAVRIGIDRDEDSYFDRDEIDACTDPADPDSTPDSPGCTADLAGDDDNVNITDLLALLAAWGAPGGAADLDCSGTVDISDLLALLAQWGPCP